MRWSFDSKEEEFIKEFTSELGKKGLVNSDAVALLKNLRGYQVSFEQVVNRTKLFLSNFSSEDQRKISDKIEEFIDAIIKADNVVAPQEADLQKRWKLAFA